MEHSQRFLNKKAVILGVANERSLAWHITEKLSQEGAKIALNFYGDALEKRVRPLAHSIKAEIVEPCDVSSDEQIESFFNKVEERWGAFDILIHSIAYANRQDLENPFIETKRPGFSLALETSCYSLIAATRCAFPLMKEHGGSIITLSYYGAQKVIPHYNIMGVAKAALEASVRYLSLDLGLQKIRINAISAGPVKTLAAAGVKNFRTMLEQAKLKNPLQETISGEDVANMAAFLCSDESKHITASTFYVDSGAHAMGA